MFGVPNNLGMNPFLIPILDPLLAILTAKMALYPLQGLKPQSSALRSVLVKVDPSSKAYLQTPVRAVFSKVGFS